MVNAGWQLWLIRILRFFGLMGRDSFVTPLAWLMVRDTDMGGDGIGGRC